MSADGAILNPELCRRKRNGSFADGVPEPVFGNEGMRMRSRLLALALRCGLVGLPYFTT
jgi:hypothetical protein